MGLCKGIGEVGVDLPGRLDRFGVVALNQKDYGGGGSASHQRGHFANMACTPFGDGVWEPGHPVFDEGYAFGLKNHLLRTHTGIFGA